MKRSEMLKLIANQLSFLNGTFNGVKDVFTPAEMASADVILTTMEGAGILPPRVRVEEVRKAISPEGEEGTFVSWTYKSVWEDESKQSDKIMPSALTEEEVKELIENDEDLQDE